MLNITIITIGKLREKSWQTMSLEYQKRISPYAKIKLLELKAESFRDDNKEKAKEAEEERISKALEKYSQENIYLLAERGKEYDSLELANWFNRKQALVLVIAGALGFSDNIYNKYPQISLSALTFPHELARIVLLEQIYRSCSILNNKKYHY